MPYKKHSHQMPARNTVFTDFQIPRYYYKKENTSVIPRQHSPIEEIPDEREIHRYRRCLISACVGCCITVAVILAGLLPALIIILTQPSTTNTSVIIANTGVSSGGNLNGATISSVTSASSTSNTANSVSAGSSTQLSTSASGFTVGGAVTAETTAWYGYEDVTVNCSVNLINITIIITVQKTVNATYNDGTHSTFSEETINQAYLDSGTQIIYTWTLASEQTIQASGSPYTVEAQFNLYGINQITSADTYSVTATTETGLTNTISGNF